ncbi:glycine cleavage system H protein [Candidatus Hakubella thermalkaliphila]|uniref:Glycine cleavage system H protein n=2 Tax=Candidatus Hakubella thermalkaliphila TaxID=2754717 RepID=A0A6V8QD31_9ACTN|nr:glycine cleavage system protein GcvH [Candidatus Hakubella thermalkaliphila]MBT9169941.1 Glycine cleavage system H protein [Actinomycetota bacterium]GFP26920.1 glycine cleavage system H protein [Candidatus Hakubella thermalkaliphila]GFP31560.1 glycine cleavage system H protein [Candidatus Hakubella thermalkaliphila]GFP36672.1 glycine cleavage system H protein [Candidatus Hakubella thermalkaliphila]GFP39182.1 glycine cleavage system H protein [Candidatus Hakubella thermalkaliphila]
MNPEGLLYSSEHEWVRRKGDHVVLGITDYAQQALGDIVYLEVPEEGTQVVADEAFAEVESVKAVSDIYSPVTGEIVKVNQKVIESPEIIHEDPYGKGWIVVIEMSDPSELDNLMTAEEYEEFIRELE